MSTKRTAIALAASLLLSTTILSAADAAPKVVASIKPLHSLVASVMKGVGEPELLIDGQTSPHDFVLRPSDATRLQEAEVVFWVGEDLERALEKPLEAIAGKAKSVALSEIAGLTFPAEEEEKDEDHAGHDHDKHDHAKEAKADDHDGHDHDEHAGEKHDHDGHKEEAAKKDDHDGHDHGEHDHDEHADKDHDHGSHKKEAKAAGHDDDDHGDEHAGHDHAHDHGRDPHVWLNPKNAAVMLRSISASLSEADPENATTYQANADEAAKKLEELDAKLASDLKPLAGRGFFVFHAAYGHMRQHYGLGETVVITANPETTPSAARVQAIKDMLSEGGEPCVYSEPQFPTKLVTLVTENTKAKTGVLDPLGASIPAGPELYATLMSDLASALKACLGR